MTGEMTGAEAIIESLRREKVKVIFGYPGGSVLPLYDALYHAKDIQHILTRHEQGAAHAADGFARATGKVGVCIATSGPGATNLVTGIANAYMDSIPFVAITGQVGTALIGRDSFQEADITGITYPITKHNYLVKNTEDIPRVIAEAFYIASTGRPGPVLVDVPKDVQMNKAKFKFPEKVGLPGYKPTYKGHPKQIKAAVSLIQASKRPLIYAGGGVISSGASKELHDFAVRLDIPVCTTLLGKGCFPESHHLSLGMLGMHGTVYANYATTECDLLLAIGARFDDRVTGRISHFAPKAKVIHIDIDPAEIGKNVPANIPIVGDVKSVLEDLMDHINKVGLKKKHEEWLKKIEDWKKKYPLTYKKGNVLKPQYVVEKISDLTKGDAIIVTEVGQNQMWAAQYYKFLKPRTMISSGGLGTMGYGFPAAIGAQIGCPDKLVIDIAGDGSIQMNIQELTTAVNNRLPIVVAILNNNYLGMVRQWQELLHGKRYSHTDIHNNPDFVKVAEAFGARAMRVTKSDEVESALKDAFKVKDKPVFIDFVVDEEENVLPFVPAGQALNEMIVD